MSNKNVTSVEKWRDTLERLNAAEQILREVQNGEHNFTGKMNDRMNEVMATIRGNKQELMDRIDYEHPYNVKSEVLDNEASKKASEEIEKLDFTE